ncbi:unnamed protein product [Ceratitis capitata]|uniref:(Mediterranean fruit fly) hypothetical protein n=1 Tax=Ceratitis capitata TaxID=7213 RepID=W8BPS9_CERCA|nr:unnamed protein product [Ceratitis capitata]
MSNPRSSRKSSFVWNFFDADDNEKARCRICKRFFSRKGCCTSGLITHLKKTHTEIFLLHLNKGLVSLDGDKSDDIKKEPSESNGTEQVNKKPKANKVAKRKRTENDSDTSDGEQSSEDSTDFREDEEQQKKPIEQMCLQEDEYPIINIERTNGIVNPFLSPPSSQSSTPQIEALLTKQLQIQAKMYKEVKEKLEQINSCVKESERINRKKYRLKAQKLRMQKEELKKKELHRKEMHRLRLLELDILNRKNVQDQLHYDQL